MSNFSSVIIVAAGSGRRMALGYNKLLYRLAGQAVIAHTVKVFARSPLIDQIVLVINPSERSQIEACLGEYAAIKPLTLIAGGKTRTDSVRAGLRAVDLPANKVLVHDGARPFVSQALIKQIVKLLDEQRCVIPVLRLVDTVKQVENQHVVQTVDREQLRAVQTPQGFQRPLIESLYFSNTELAGLTDDSMLAERAGYRVDTVEGESQNIKLTTLQDIKFAEFLLSTQGVTNENRIRL